MLTSDVRPMVRVVNKHDLAALVESHRARIDEVLGVFNSKRPIKESVAWTTARCL